MSDSCSYRQTMHRRQCMVWRYEHESDIVSLQHSIPFGLHFHELSIGLEQIRAIKVTPPVHEDFRAARKTVDEIPSPLIFCEHAVVQTVLFQEIRGEIGRAHV